VPEKEKIEMGKKKKGERDENEEGIKRGRGRKRKGEKMK